MKWRKIENQFNIYHCLQMEGKVEEQINWSRSCNDRWVRKLKAEKYNGWYVSWRRWENWIWGKLWIQLNVDNDKICEDFMCMDHWNGWKLAKIVNNIETKKKWKIWNLVPRKIMEVRNTKIWERQVMILKVGTIRKSQCRKM